MYTFVQFFANLCYPLCYPNVLPIQNMKLPTITVILKPVKDANGQQSICIRVTYKRVRTVKSLGIKTSEALFRGNATGFKHVLPGDGRYAEKNALIKKEYERLELAFYALAMADDLTPDTVKRDIENKATGGLNFFAIGTEYIKQITNAGSKRRWQYCLQLIHDYAPALSLKQITPKWLTMFEDYLKVTYDNINTRRTPLKFLRAVINYAIQRGADISYPFGVGQYKLPSEEKTKRNYLSRTQLAEVAKFVEKTKDANCIRAGRWFLLQCYSGMRYSDIEVWKPDHVKDDQIYFSDTKTNTPHSIPLYPALDTAIANVAEFKPMAYEQYKSTLRTIGVAVALPFALTSHVARHTFAVQFLEDGGSVFYLQNLLGHGDIKTTLIYTKVTDHGLKEEMKRIRGKK